MQTKTKVTIFAVVLVLIGCGIVFTPHLLRLEKVKGQFVKQVGKKLESSLEVGAIQWSWLPLPHVTVKDVELENEYLSLKLPKAWLYPDWWSVFGKKVEVGKILLIEPEITIKKWPPTPLKSKDKSLPPLHVVVADGSLNLVANGQFPMLKTKQIDLRSFAADIKFNGSQLDLTLTGVPSFGQRLTIAGQYFLEKQYYKLDLDCRKLRLHEAFFSLADEAVVPVDSQANFKATLEGKGLDTIHANLVGDMPCFLVYPTDKKVLLNCGFMDLDFVKSGGDLLVKVKELELKEPGLKLAGEIRRRVNDKATEPSWHIDLQGADINLHQVREAVLTLWGENEVSQIVCEIVLSGIAEQATYKFDGTLADFEDIRSMTVTAKAKDVDLMLPVGDIYLGKASGDVLIEDGRLIVQHASATLGQSSGKDCFLVMGIPSDDDYFLLDLDVAAHLPDLPGVLDRLVDDPAFLKELHRFSNVSGKASGKVNVGNDLNDLDVEVYVDSMEGSADYGPLPWNFSISSGKLTVLPESVLWQDVVGTYGPHKVDKSSGSLAWHDEMMLSLDELEGAFFGPDLEMIDLTPLKTLNTIINENISSVDGFCGVSGTSIHGPINTPSDWQVRTRLDFSGVKLQSPRFPGAVTTESGIMLVTENLFKVSAFQGRMQGSEIKLDLELTHERLDNWQGQLRFSSTLNDFFAKWLREENIIPDAFFPVVPSRMQNVLMRWRNDTTTVTGTILPGLTGKPAAQADFTVFSTPADPLQIKVDVAGFDKKATLIFDMLDNIPETFHFSWTGIMHEDTADILLSHKELLQGSISGDFELTLPENPKEALFKGSLDAQNMRWYWDREAERYFDVQDLKVEGQGKSVDIERLQFALSENEVVTGLGQISGGKNGLEVAADLKSTFITRQTALSFLDDLQRLKEEIALSTAVATDNNILPWHVTGAINFDLDEFVSGVAADAEQREQTLVWKPLQGEIRLHPYGKYSATITSGLLCCLNTSGEWYSDSSLGQSFFTIASACPANSRLEDVLPCLGYPQDLIEGEINLDAKLVGVLDNWQDGYLNVQSSKGRILRMHLLSKIFSVINFTDLFTDEANNNDGRGFAYKKLVFKTHIKDNELIIDEAVIHGEGLNIFARGKMNIVTFEADFTVLIAPLKTLDAIISSVPLVGKVVGGPTATLVTIPVGVKGNLRDPQVTVLPLSAVGEGVVGIVKRTLLLPFNILSPILLEPAPGQLEQNNEDSTAP